VTAEPRTVGGGGCAALVNLAEQSSEPNCFVNEFGQFVCQ
jgi:hypothetical protein